MPPMFPSLFEQKMLDLAISIENSTILSEKRPMFEMKMDPMSSSTESGQKKLTPFISVKNSSILSEKKSMIVDESSQKGSSV